MPQISVIVPVYKVEPYLHRCVDSILAQTFTDFDLILVDDGSPDNCGVICDEYTAKDSRIHVIHQPNGGLSAARNAGIDWAFANSDSQWLSFIDSDDWVHPEYLTRLYEAVASFDAGISTCLFNKTREETVCFYAANGIEPVLRSFEEYFCDTDTEQNTISACGKLYAKNLFYNWRFPLGKLHEDLFVIPYILNDSQWISVVHFPLYYYYVSGDSITRSSWTPNRLDEIEGSEKLLQFVQKKHLKRASLRAKSRYLNIINKQLRELKLSHDLSVIEQYEKVLVRRLKKLLLFYGRDIAPISDNKWLYGIAFPCIDRLYWTVKGISGKVKRIICSHGKKSS